jgi:hypothetical protein
MVERRGRVYCGCARVMGRSGRVFGDKRSQGWRLRRRMKQDPSAHQLVGEREEPEVEEAWSHAVVVSDTRTEEKHCLGLGGPLVSDAGRQGPPEPWKVWLTGATAAIRHEPRGHTHRHQLQRSHSRNDMYCVFICSGTGSPTRKNHHEEYVTGDASFREILPKHQTPYQLHMQGGISA